MNAPEFNIGKIKLISTIQEMKIAYELISSTREKRT